MIAGLLATADLFIHNIEKNIANKFFQSMVIVLILFTHQYFILTFSHNLVGFICYLYSLSMIASVTFTKKIGPFLIILSSLIEVLYYNNNSAIELPNIWMIPLFGTCIALLVKCLIRLNIFTKPYIFALIYYPTIILSVLLSNYIITKEPLTPEIYLMILMGSTLIYFFSMFSYKKTRMEEKQWIEREKRSKFDELTGLFNYASFTEDLLKLNEQKENVSVVMIDLDHFKNVNDTLGHIAGNVLLKEFSNLTRQLLKEKTTIPFTFYRFGGEEFCLIFYSNSTEEIKNLMDEVRETVKNYDFDLPNYQIGMMTFSSGIETSSSCEFNLMYALDNADKALYQAKRNGRNQIIVFDSRRKKLI
ncbi:hypothetical protein RV04_GL000731 [Enterococcus hermanniensis]|uniref:GGDEF domain-containing protein n=2 Tax=Enterococcus hermanniensis TaxID=249189 RepID=A0A1L8TFR8_9ENTE|nr:hypothetical protein RV04_GL000731 [Enterococcus hermanniensis]